MQFSKLSKNTLKYLSVLVLLVAVVMGVLIEKGLYSASLDTRSQNPLIVLATEGPCNSSNLYTSLPPKCKSFDGKFHSVPGISIAVTPKDK